MVGNLDTQSDANLIALLVVLKEELEKRRLLSVTWTTFDDGEEDEEATEAASGMANWLAERTK